MKMKLSRFLFLSLVLVAFFNIIGCKDQSVMIYTVAFDSNGGELTSNSTQNILSGDQAIAPSNPKREGCIFTGWYTEPECLNLYDFNNQVVDSFALYAGWARIEYTIVFDSNGGEFYGNTSETIFSGDKVNPPVLEPYNTYCSFTGWYTESECINLYDFNTPVTSSFTLYAGWIVSNYPVIFNANGGYFENEDNYRITEKEISVLTGEKLPELKQPSTDGGYDFTGWYTEPECVNLYNFNSQVTSSFTLYAGWTEVSCYTVSFNANGGWLSSDSYYYTTKGQTISPPSDPYSYCSFTGWYTEPECINLYDFNSPVTSSFTLYAGWKLDDNYFSVTFNANGGTLTDVSNVIRPSSESISQPSDPIREGYSFTGWYTDVECTNKYEFNGQGIYTSFTLYAGWATIPPCTVTFNANGGELTDNSNQTVTTGNKVIQPSSPTRNEYTFTGWYTDSSCTTKYDFNSQVTSDLILFAGWEIKTYTITFNANGGILSSATTQTILSGNKITEPTTPTRNEYIFTGWYTDVECTNKYEFNGQGIYTSFTLYAGWATIPPCTVTFNANGGELTDNSNQTVTTGNKVIQPSSPTRNEYTFTGWYTEPECINLYDFNSPVTSSFTLYAGWKLDDNYFSVTFNANGGTLTGVSNVIRPSSESISQPSDPIREGYYFTGWYTDVECTNKYEFNGQGIYTSLTLYAGWTTKPPCTVTFNANGGYFGDYSNSETIMTVTVLNGTCVAHPNNLSYMFMVFSGWYTESECKNKYDLNTPVTKNITLYAGWIPVHSINFESNGNSYFDYQYVVEGDLLICPDKIPENYGKVFTGWYIEPECTNLYDFNKPVTSSFTLYAGWGEKLIYHTITFDANGGTLTSEPTQVVLRYGKITEPINPTREGYTFTGWYDDTQCTDLIDFDYIVVDHDRTLYAGWTVTTYTVTFNANGGDLTGDTTQTVTIGNKVTQPSSPILSGYTFTGWYTDSSCTNLYDFNSQVTSDFTLYAGWVVSTYTVTFNANGGTLTDSISQIVTSGNIVTCPSNPSRNEYMFTGWYTDLNCSNLYDFNSRVTSDLILYAGWEIKTYVVSFNANGGTLTGNTSQTVSTGNKIIQPSNPTCSGYTFTGWYTDSSCTILYDFNSQITSDFTLYAGWESLEEFIAYLFDNLEGSGPHDIVLSGEFTEEIMTLLVSKIKETSIKINLDLRNTTGLVTIDDFKDCTGLTSIEIPISVISRKKNWHKIIIKNDFFYGAI